MLDQILKKLGAPESLLEKITSGKMEKPDEVTDWIQKNFINKELAIHDDSVKEHYTGKFTGIFANKLKESFGLEKADIEADGKLKKWEDIVITAKEKQESTLSELKTELAAAKSGDNDKRTKELEKKIEKMTGDIDAYKNSLEKAQAGIQDWEQKYESKTKEYKINSTLSEIKGQLPFRSDLDKNQISLMKRGFEAELNDKYTFDVEKEGESEKVVIRQKDGKPVVINSQPVHDPKAVLMHVGSEFGVFAKNKGGQKSFGSFPNFKKDDDDKPKSAGVSKAMERAEAQKAAVLASKAK